MTQAPRITTMLWFDSEAEEAARYYVSIFPNSSVGRTARYSKVGHEHHGRPDGSVMTVAFTLDGRNFVALNGGPQFTFNESISLVVNCATQAEIDHYWEKLGAGGDPKAQMCGWLKDRFGVSWQVVPAGMDEIMGGDPARAGRAMTALMKMKKPDIAALRNA